MSNESEAHKFAEYVCNGNNEAKHFCDLWYKYCHSIDDILDTMEDGRPTMSKESILRTFITAAELYNSPFYIKYQSALFSCVITVTNMYADSVAWESSPDVHKRIMADVMRICGDEMFFIVAMICGGWEHLRKISPLIRERDYVRQHSEPSDFH